MTRCLIISVFILLLGCTRRSVTDYFVEMEIPSDTMSPNLIIEKDSIDILEEQRLNQEFNSTIFAGLRFGDSPSTVQTKMRNAEWSIKVPNGDKIGIVHIRKYEAEYYRSQLASLTLYAEEDELISALYTLFRTKYGEGEWRYKDCIINITPGWRKEYNLLREAGYASGAGTPMYYDSFTGEQTKCLTKDSTFLIIIYKNLRLTDLIKQDKIIADSLEQLKKLQEIQAEKELAAKLRNEVATNI